MTPQHESKVKHIRQRVEDMNWQDAKKKENGVSCEPTAILEADEELEEDKSPNAEHEVGTKSESDKAPEDLDDDLEKGILGDQSSSKRKLQDRTVSSFSQKELVNGESAKRPRDEPDIDVNPRDSKRPSPPPSKEAKNAVLVASSSNAAPNAPTVCHV
jgi:Ran-binding protein 3